MPVRVDPSTVQTVDGVDYIKLTKSHTFQRLLDVGAAGRPLARTNIMEMIGELHQQAWLDEYASAKKRVQQIEDG